MISATLVSLFALSATVSAAPKAAPKFFDCAKGTDKYYSIVGKNCGESCIPPSQVAIDKIFESGLTAIDATTGEHPCNELGYSKFVNTETHGWVGVDLWNKAAAPATSPVLGGAAFANAPCCVDACASGTDKYYSIDTSNNMCGESCIAPSQVAIDRIFESGLTLATSVTPCADLHYSVYYQNDVHGWVSVDLYKPDGTTL